MCQHITTIYRCNRCNNRIITDNITCNAAWYKRLGRQQCDNTDWTLVEDHSKKLWATCAERGSPGPITLEPLKSKPVVPGIPSPVLEPPSVFGPLSELNAYTAPYANARLEAWLKNHPEQASVPLKEKTDGDLRVAMSHLDFGDEHADGTGSPSGNEQMGSIASTQPASTSMLFTNVQTHSPDEIDCYGFEQQKVTGGIDPGSSLEGKGSSRTHRRKR